MVASARTANGWPCGSVRTMRQSTITLKLTLTRPDAVRLARILIRESHTAAERATDARLSATLSATLDSDPDAAGRELDEIAKGYERHAVTLYDALDER